MFPYYHGRNLFNQMKANTISIWRGEDLPEEPQQDKLYGHCIMFFETMTESLMQLCLNTLVLREFGISPNRFEASNQVSGFFSSLISIILLFAKVRTNYNQINVVFIPLGFSKMIFMHIQFSQEPLLHEHCSGVPPVLLFFTTLGVSLGSH